VKRIAFAFLLLAALPASAATWPVAGDWFGTGQPDDKSEMYLDHFGADGSFRNQHRYCREGKIALEIKETGRWWVSGDILTVDIATVSGRSQPRTDHYRLISVDAKMQNYIVLPSQFAYHARKVAGDFPMPPCDLTS
jgi:hypothetical protein